VDRPRFDECYFMEIRRAVKWNRRSLGFARDDKV